jgi:colanic acid/amylovoran biosynthesis protein
MHANIAALDSGVPVLAVGYSHKTRGIMADLGLEEWVIGIQDLDASRLIATITRLQESSAAYRRQLVAHLPEIRQRSRGNIELITRIIESESPGT